MFKRVFLLIATNFAVMLLLGTVLTVLRSTGVLPEGPWSQLLVISAVFGFGGSFISLLASKFIAKWSTGAQVITSPRSETERWLLETVERHAKRAGIGMPEVAVYESPDANAFATGASKDNSLVAVSTGLLRSMNRPQIEAVLGHEIAHVANGDMVTLTLIQGVLNTFVFFLARVIGMLVDGALSRGEDRGRGGGIGSFFVVMIAQSVLGALAMIIVAWFSRQREFRADAGGANLTSPADMAGALAALARDHEPGNLPKNMAAFGVRPGRGSSLWSTHPPIEERIARLKQLEQGGGAVERRMGLHASR
jgi:heat shock protein HtpX